MGAEQLAQAARNAHGCHALGEFTCLTFDAVHVDFGNGAFAHGQTYVALSRCRTLDGLTLSRHLRRTDVRVDDAAFAFADRAVYADLGAFRVGRIEA